MLRVWQGVVVLKLFSVSAISLLSIVGVCHAGLLEWSTEKQSDPFSGGESVTVDFMTSFRSGIILLCDSTQEGLTVRSVPGFDFDDRLDGFTPKMKFAFDGKLLFDADGSVGKVGDNLAFAQVQLTEEQAKQFVAAFAAAKRQIAVDDGISEKPQLLTAQGSTESGSAVVSCISKQAPK